ncbi:MAG: putative 3-oxoacyl-[acyl-carrier protein] reductase [Aeromicrobium sp.]|nr:putative 3-oxoacyl-[acyl-carrier protein] reductase [Aeromicrobium sp.]
MDLGISGKIALVSGGSRGIGRAATEILAREGVKVVIAARSQDAIDETVEAVAAAGGTATGIAADMTTGDGVESAVEHARRTFGDPDIAISNVHGPTGGTFLELTADDFERVMREMTMSVIHLSKAVIPAMRDKGWGRLVNIGSGAAKEPPPDLAHILANTARASVVTLNKSLANDFGKDGITVNTIGTGFIATDRMWSYVRGVAAERGMDADEMMSIFTQDVPLRRPGQPEEIGGVIAFLCSQQAGYITGQLIPVEGGILRSAF